MVKQVDRFYSVLNTPLQTPIQVDPRAACNGSGRAPAVGGSAAARIFGAKIGRSAYSAAIFAAAAAFSA